MYQEIYSDPAKFCAYLGSERFTIPSKAAVADAVVSELGPKGAAARVCLVPCDIGTYYCLLKERLPSAIFTCIDRQRVPLAHIVTNYLALNDCVALMDAQEIRLLGRQFDCIICPMGKRGQ
jgi:hypothetical protein